MRVALTEVGRCGRLDLVFTERGGQTVLSDSYCEVPFKITRLLPTASSSAHLILMQCTPGLFGGDTVEMTVRVERGARVRITQQSATRIHPSEGRTAIQTSRVHVEGGGQLDLFLEPVIPFSGSRLRQTTTIEVERGARLLFWEGLMAGRVGRGEVWEFKELSSETSLRSSDRLLYLDRFHLQPDCASPSTRWVMDAGVYVGTGLCFGENAARFAEGLHVALPEAGVDILDECLAAARIVTADGPAFHRCRDVFGATVEQLKTPLLAQEGWREAPGW